MVSFNLNTISRKVWRVVPHHCKQVQCTRPLTSVWVGSICNGSRYFLIIVTCSDLLSAKASATVNDAWQHVNCVQFFSQCPVCPERGRMMEDEGWWVGEGEDEGWQLAGSAATWTEPLFGCGIAMETGRSLYRVLLSFSCRWPFTSYVGGTISSPEKCLSLSLDGVCVVLLCSSTLTTSELLAPAFIVTLYKISWYSTFLCYFVSFFRLGCWDLVQRLEK